MRVACARWVAVVVALVALGGCGDDPANDAARTATTVVTDVEPSAAQVAALSFRPVLQNLTPMSPDAERPQVPGLGDEIAPDAEGYIEGLPEVTDAGTTTPVYRVGPIAVTAAALESATAKETGTYGWAVEPIFREGAKGIDLFNAVAARCNLGDETCPTRQLAIVSDGKVVSAPTIQEQTFRRDAVQIAGSLDQAKATDIANRINDAIEH